jgi:hypothetical protein
MTEENEWVYITQLVLGSISCVCSLVLVLKFILNKEVRSYAFELVVCLSIASFFNSFSYLFNYIDTVEEEEHTNCACLVQSFIMIWFEASQIIWATIISIYTLNAFSDYYKEEVISPIRRSLTLFIGFIIPLSTPTIGYLTNNLGVAGRWCWIRMAELNYTFILSYFSVVWFMILITITTFFMIKCRNTNIKEDDRQAAKEFRNRLLLFPLISFICWFPCTIERLDLDLPERVTDWFDIIQLMLVHFQGILYALIILYDSNTFSLIKLFKKCTSIFKTRESKPLDRLSLLSTQGIIVESESYG